MYNLQYKLSKNQQEELFIKLARCLAYVRTAEESAQLLKDLLSESEVLMLARRLQIAELLIAGKTYVEIREEMKASPGTIARVQTWLTLYGQGYRSIINRMSKHQVVENDSSKPLVKLKRQYPAYFWPQLVLEELVKSASKREKRRLAKVVEQLRDKTRLSKELMKLL